jgi:hypothetical protein
MSKVFESVGAGMKWFSPALRVFLVYFLACSLLPILFFSLKALTDSGSDIVADAKNVLSQGGLGFVFAFSIAMFRRMFGIHRFWHLLLCAALCFVLVPYFLINHDVGFSFFVVFGLPVYLFAALVGWLMMWWTQRKP